MVEPVLSPHYTTQYSLQTTRLLISIFITCKTVLSPSNLIFGLSSVKMLGLSNNINIAISIILTLLNIPPLIELSFGQSRGFTVLKKLSLSRSICSRIFPKGSSIFKAGICDYSRVNCGLSCRIYADITRTFPKQTEISSPGTGAE